MRVHHISCGSFRPPCRRLTQGDGGVVERASFVVHCLIVELPDRLLLVDTGMSRAEMDHPLTRLGMGMTWGGGVTAGTTAVEHLERLGQAQADVTDILMTHLDKDHAGGLPDFPQARIHVHPAELEAATRRCSFIEKQRYNPEHLAHRPDWRPLSTDTATSWFEAPAFAVDGLPETVRVIPLPGHTAGHCGVALQRDDGSWLLHCGDAVYHPAWLDGGKPPPVIQLVESILQHNAAARAESREKLIHLKAQGVTVICAHDRETFEKLGGVA